MTVTIYIIDGGVWDGQFAFKSWNSSGQHLYDVVVPDGSELVGVYGDTFLCTPQGSRLKASQVVMYGRLGVVGFQNAIPHLLGASKH